MSIMDDKLVFCESFSLASISASSNSNVTNVLNLGVGKNAWGTSKTPNIGEGGDLFLHVICEDTDFASAGSPVVTIDLHTAATAAMSSPSTIVTVVTDKTPNDGDVIIRQKLPAGAFKQYSTLNVATTNALTAGAITAWLGFDTETPVADKK